MKVCVCNAFCLFLSFVGNDSLDEGTTFQEDNGALESKAEAGIVDKAFLGTMNGTNVDINATFGENAEGLPYFQKGIVRLANLTHIIIA